MSFEQLAHVAKLGCIPGSSLVFEWQQKRQHLAVYRDDLPQLASDLKNAARVPYEFNQMITLVDAIPRIRLSSACEASVSCLYGMAEIAAQFGNKVSKGLLPASFNALRKKAERGDQGSFELISWVSDFSWYKKVRELRTEWTHFSTIFVGEHKDGEPVLVVRCHRRSSDREEFANEINIQIPDLVDWIVRAISVIDNFGNYLIMRHILPNLDPNARLVTAKHDARGWPVITQDHRFEIEEITVGEYLAQCGIKLDR